MIYELFSARRKKAELSGSDDVFQYDVIPDKLRVQIQQVLFEAIGPQFAVSAYDLYERRHNPEGWNDIHKVLCRELGVHRLGNQQYDLAIEGVMNWIGTSSALDFIDTLEVCCRCIAMAATQLSDYQRQSLGMTVQPVAALQEINYRLREAGVGYSYADGYMLRVDSEYLHEEVTKAALRFLNHKGFDGPRAEFLQAHEHYRTREYPQAITEAAKAFESTLKAVCDLKGWSYDKGDRATDLLKRVKAKGLWPDYLDTSFDQLLATLNSGLPRVRNNDGAHGQGSAIRQIPHYLAAYAMHLAAAKITLIGGAATEK